MKNGNMNILRLTPHYYFPAPRKMFWPVHYDQIGGMQTQIYRQSLALERHGIKQTVLTLGIPNVSRQIHQGRHLKIVSVRLPMLPFKSVTRGTIGLNSSWALGAVWWAFNQLFKEERFDLVHCHCSGVKEPLLAGLAVAGILKIPLVYTIHCSSLVTYHAMNSLDDLLLPLTRMSERLAIKQADHIITLTDNLINFYKRSDMLLPESFSIIPDCIDAHDFRSFVTEEGKELFRKEYNIPSGKRIVLYCGRVAIEKGWPYFFDVAMRMQRDDVFFLVCGDGNEGDKLQKLIRKHNMESRVTMTGFVSQKKVALALSIADVLVLPSLHEEFGSVTLEAMAVGCPIIAFEIGGIKRVLTRDRTALLVEPKSVAGIVGAIHELLDNEEKRQYIIGNARQLIDNCYGLDAWVESTLDVYKRMIRVKNYAG